MGIHSQHQNTVQEQSQTQHMVSWAAMVKATITHIAGITMHRSQSEPTGQPNSLKLDTELKSPAVGHKQTWGSVHQPRGVAHSPLRVHTQEGADNQGEFGFDDEQVTGHGWYKWGRCKKKDSPHSLTLSCQPD